MTYVFSSQYKRPSVNHYDFRKLIPPHKLPHETQKNILISWNYRDKEILNISLKCPKQHLLASWFYFLISVQEWQWQWPSTTLRTQSGHVIVNIQTLWLLLLIQDVKPSIILSISSQFVEFEGSRRYDTSSPWACKRLRVSCVTTLGKNASRLSAMAAIPSMHRKTLLLKE